MKKLKNILFIAVDDLRPEINCFGKSKLHTPNLDKIASNGLQFNRAYCQVPVCGPSRISLLTGKRPSIPTGNRWALGSPSDGEPTLPGYFKTHGFQTISIGKVYHINDDDEAGWTRRYTDTFNEQAYTVHGYCAGYHLEENRRKLQNFGRQFSQSKAELELPPICEAADAPDDAYPDGIIAQRAIEVLREFQGQEDPLFLALGFYRPHLPWAVPQKYWDLYDRDDVDLAANPFLPQDGIGISNLGDFLHYGEEEIDRTYSDLGHYRGDDFPLLSEEKQRECIHGYWASVSFTDAQIGKVLAELESLGQLDETVIVLWGDNGWHLGEHKLWSKASSFEESTRIPLLVSVPGTTNGAASDALVELVDLYPTLCDLAGIGQPPHLEGLSLAPLLDDPQKEWKTGVFSMAAQGHAKTLRTDRYRLTRYTNVPTEGDLWHLRESASGHAFELFDHHKDPMENVNVARRPESSALVEELDRILTDGWAPIRDRVHSKSGTT